MATKFDLNNLSREQLVALCLHLDSNLNVQILAANELIDRVSKNSACPAEIIEILNEWSTICNLINEKSAREVDRIVAARDGSIN